MLFGVGSTVQTVDARLLKTFCLFYIKFILVVNCSQYDVFPVLLLYNLNIQTSKKNKKKNKPEL